MTERTDRELLELAARAYGLDETWYYAGDFSGMSRNGFRDWNPRNDDGDALRLAVKLRLCLFLEIPRIGVGPMVDGPELYLEEGEDPCAATRRAIVFAAAEIGAKP